MRAWLVLIALALIPAAAARGGEAELGEEPAPATVGEQETHFQKGFGEQWLDASRFPRLRQLLHDAPPFFRDTQLELKARGYFLNRHQDDGTRNKAIAAGGSIHYRSGWLKEFFSMGATLYASQKLSGDKDESGTKLLSPRQQSFTVLGEAFGRLRWRGHTLTVGRQELDLPYVNRRFNRMVPNTFEGVVFSGQYSKLEYGGGYLSRIKRRDEDDFMPMSDAAGVVGTGERGLAFAGARYRPVEDLSIGLINYYVKDIINIAYSELNYIHPLGPSLELRMDGQFTHQMSVGDDRRLGTAYSTWVAGGRVAASYHNAILALSFSTTDDGEDIFSPYGTYPGFVNMMRADYKRAGEDAWVLGFSYEFGRIGMPGLSTAVRYGRGSGAENPNTGASRPDRNEWNLTVDYRVPEGFLKGFWLRVRGSVRDRESADRDANELRVILNYSLPIL